MLNYLVILIYGSSIYTKYSVMQPFIAVLRNVIAVSFLSVLVTSLIFSKTIRSRLSHNDTVHTPYVKRYSLSAAKQRTSLQQIPIGHLAKPIEFFDKAAFLFPVPFLFHLVVFLLKRKRFL